MVSKLVALCDCNNFFVSCERLFRPECANSPVVVLSSNDGCVVSRSEEAKEMKIPMGAPWYQIRKLFLAAGGVAFSSNASLYKNISARVMAVLSEYTPQLEIYSIDEAFLDFSAKSIDDPERYAETIRQRILKSLGIPTSIGIAPTKTLAKLAAGAVKKTDKEKKEAKKDVHFISDPDSPETLELLQKTPVSKIWGIGYRVAPKLFSWGIVSALEFRNLGDDWIRRNMSVRGLRTAWELRGIPCFPLEKKEPAPQSIQVSRSFQRPLSGVSELKAPIAEYILSAAEKMRADRLKATELHLFCNTNRFSDERYLMAKSVPFHPATDDTDELIRAGFRLLKDNLDPQHLIIRAGVVLLCSPAPSSPPLFETQEERGMRHKRERFMQAADRINHMLGERGLIPALLSGIELESWKPRHNENASSWQDMQKLPAVHPYKTEDTE